MQRVGVQARRHVWAVGVAEDLLGGYGARNGRISRGQPLGHGDNVGPDAELLIPEPLACAPHAHHNFIDDEQDLRRASTRVSEQA